MSRVAANRALKHRSGTDLFHDAFPFFASDRTVANDRFDEQPAYPKSSIVHALRRGVVDVGSAVIRISDGAWSCARMA